MLLNGIDFGPVTGASGVQGWFGEGYPYHKWMGPFGPNFKDMTFVAKTTTLLARPGNMPLKDDLTPKERLPKCIVVKPFAGAVLNAVGLSGPGTDALLDRYSWQQRTTPFFISFMSVASTAEARLIEVELFAKKLRTHLPHFRAPVGLQLNLSCPNAGLDPSGLIADAQAALAALGGLGIPIVPKFNLLVAPEAALKIAEHPTCAGICMSNTLPWGKLPDRVNWSGLFGAEISPLKDMGGGGLSGAPIQPLVVEWVKKARAIGLNLPLNVGGGILSPRDVDTLVNVGLNLAHDSVFLGSVAMLRPWRVQRIIRRAFRLRRRDQSV